MFTSTVFLALAGFLGSATLESPSWHADYGSAQQLGREGHKPLAVFIGYGKTGWNRVSEEKRLGKEVQQLLAKNYVCVYIDTDRKVGKQLAAELEVPDGIGLILSDHTGKYQAFRHEGNMSNDKLVRYLSRYADPERILRTTETNPAPQLSYGEPSFYPAAAQYYYQPVSYPVYSGGGGRSC